MQYHGGAYATIYYDDDPLDQVIPVFEDLGARMRQVDRLFRAARPVWKAYFAPLDMHARPGHFLSPGAFAVAPHRGLYASIREVLDATLSDPIADWERDVLVPELPCVSGVAAVYRCRGHGAESERFRLTLAYLDEDPATVVTALRARSPRWQDQGRGLLGANQSRIIFSSPYLPIVPGQYAFIGS